MPRPRKCPVTGAIRGQVPSDASAGSSRQESYSGTESPWGHRLLELAASRRQIVLFWNACTIGHKTVG